MENWETDGGSSPVLIEGVSGILVVRNTKIPKKKNTTIHRSIRAWQMRSSPLWSDNHHIAMSIVDIIFKIHSFHHICDMIANQLSLITNCCACYIGSYSTLRNWDGIRWGMAATATYKILSRLEPWRTFSGQGVWCKSWHWCFLQLDSGSKILMIRSPSSSSSSYSFYETFQCRQRGSGNFNLIENRKWKRV